MGAIPKADATSRVLNKHLLRQSVIELQEHLGLSHDPTATGEQAQAITLVDGVKPEDCVVSREIVRGRREEKD
jgi:hypothetical protein